MRNPNSYGGIVKLGGKRRKPYAVRVTVGWSDDGKQIYKYLSYHETKRDAMIALAEYNKNPYDIDSSKVTFQEIYNVLVEKEFPELSDKTVKNYKSAYQNCKPLYDMVFKEIKKNHLQGVIDEMESVSMAGVTKLLIQKIYKYAMENDIVTTNYAQYIKLPKKQAAAKKNPLTREEINFIWDNMNKIRNADIILILLYTGMRISELLEMEKENIHLEERYMIGGLKTEAGIDRTIPIHKRILPLIENRMKQSNSQYLITNKSGSQLRYDTFRKYYMRDFLDDTKVEHTVHDTRHTFVSEMSRLGIDNLIIKRIVGHSDKDITEHYTHKNLEDLLQAIDQLD